MQQCSSMEHLFAIVIGLSLSLSLAALSLPSSRSIMRPILLRGILELLSSTTSLLCANPHPQVWKWVNTVVASQFFPPSLVILSFNLILLICQIYFWLEWLFNSIYPTVVFIILYIIIFNCESDSNTKDNRVNKMVEWAIVCLLHWLYCPTVSVDPAAGKWPLDGVGLAKRWPSLGNIFRAGHFELWGVFWFYSSFILTIGHFC